MNYLSVVEVLIKLLELPEGQQWVSLKDLRQQAGQIDDGKE